MSYLVFDIETSKITPDTDQIRQEWRDLKAAGTDAAILKAKEEEGIRSKDLDSFRPLGVSCVATYGSNGEYRLWHGKETAPDEPLPSKMLPAEIVELSRYLEFMHYDKGFTIVSFNGLKFDFSILAEESNGLAIDVCHRLALAHVDILFHFFVGKGFVIKLKKACEGMRVLSKTEGMDGALAPELWAKSRADQEAVLRYCAQDVKATAALYEAIQERGRLDWIAKSGNLATWNVPGGLVTVSEALKLPLPDTSWMTGEPWTRERFYEWTVQK